MSQYHNFVQLPNAKVQSSSTDSCTQTRQLHLQCLKRVWKGYAISGEPVSKDQVEAAEETWTCENAQPEDQVPKGLSPLKPLGPTELYQR
jgi:hypothetical protein